MVQSGAISHPSLLRLISSKKNVDSSEWPISNAGSSSNVISVDLEIETVSEVASVFKTPTSG